MEETIFKYQTKNNIKGVDLIKILNSFSGNNFSLRGEVPNPEQPIEEIILSGDFDLWKAEATINRAMYYNNIKFKLMGNKEDSANTLNILLGYIDASTGLRNYSALAGAFAEEICDTYEEFNEELRRVTHDK